MSIYSDITHEMYTYNVCFERVTMSNEDEWGWDDDTNRDIEQGPGGNRRNELISAYSASSSFRGNSNSSANSIVGRADNNVLKTSSTTTKPKSNVTNTKTENKDSYNGENDDDNWDDVDGDHWDDHPAPIEKVHAPSANNTWEDPSDSSKPASLSTAAPSVEDLLKEQQLSTNVPVITSLKKTIPESKPTQTIVKKECEEDDIFASMGLSTLPKTNVKKTASVRNSLTNMPSSSAELSPLTTAELVPSESEDAGSDWGDDSDLNDLLDD